MVLSTGVPSLADKRYFLSQMSSDASWKGIASTSLCSSLTTLFMDGYLSPEVLGLFLMTPKPEPEKRKPQALQFLQVSESLCARPLSDDRHFCSPAPQPSRCVVTQHLVLGSKA